MGTISDFGGANAGDGRIQKLRKETCRSFTCSHCGKLQYATHRQVNRAARVHCLFCGGPLEETESSFKRRTHVSRSKIGRAIHVEFGDKPLRCETCDKRFRTPTALMLHVEEQGHAAAPPPRPKGFGL